MWWFLQYINMNQSQVYMYMHPPVLNPPPISLLIPTLWVVPMHWL